MNRLTKNFTKEEFNSKDGAPMPPEVFKNILELANNLQVIRDIVGPIKINSGYRSPAHNKAIGGVPNSQHVKGKAADLATTNPKELADLIEKLIEKGDMQEGGIGIYNTFVHYDIRGTKARWDKR